MYCKKCGTQNDDNARFCKSCGESLSKNKTKAIEKAPAKKSNHRMLFVGIVIIIVVLIIAAIFIMNFQKEKQYGESVEAGQNYLEEQEYAQAIACFNEAISVEPKKAAPYLGLAEAYIGQKEYKKAEEVLEKASDVADNEDEMDEIDRLTEEIRKKSSGIQEGYYQLTEENPDNPEDVNIKDGEISVIMDYEDISNLILYLYDEDGGTVYEEFVWDEEENVYKDKNVDENKECYLSVSQEENDELYVDLQYEGDTTVSRFSLKKQNYLNSTNVILAVRNYFKSEKPEKQYAVQANSLGAMYSEMYMVPVYEVGANGIKQMYTVLVASQEFEEPGVAEVYLPEDIEAVINGEKTFRDIESLEEFNVYSYFDFVNLEETTEYTDDDLLQLLGQKYADEGNVYFTSNSGDVIKADVRADSMDANISHLLYMLEVNRETGEVTEENVYTGDVVKYNLF